MVGTGEVGDLVCLYVDVHARGFDHLLVWFSSRYFFIMVPDLRHLWFDDGWSVVLVVLVG